MRKLGIIAVIAVALYAAYAFAFPTATVRYRLALSVEADGAEHTGSGVIQVTYGKKVRLLGVSGEIYVEVKGEAVAVDIPGRGTLFAVLTQGPHHRSSPEWIVPKAFGFPGGVSARRPKPASADCARSRDAWSLRRATCRCWCASATSMIRGRWSGSIRTIWRRALGRVCISSGRRSRSPGTR